MTAFPTRAAFPEGFLFGTATAAYQIEGSSFGGAGPSHWDTFAVTPGNVVGAETGAVACDSYHRWEQDLDLIRDGNFDAYRFSTSWARVMPEGRGAVNAEGLDYYDRLVDGLLERGLKPLATLYHWELPAALADLGGWRNRDVAAWFADFAEVIAGRLGDRLWGVATINEPWCVSWLSHFLGIHAPGLRDIRAAAHAMHHVLLAHGAAMERLRGMGQQNLGIVLNLEDAQPADDSPEAARAADLADAIANRWFLDGLFKGSYPEPMLASFGAHIPEGWQDDMARIAAPMDFLGVNYYTRGLYTEGTGPWPALAPVKGPKPKTEMGWEIHPEGLSRLLTRVSRDYTPLPLYVTENGMAAPDAMVGNRVEDADRTAYIAAHLEAVRTAIAEGADVRGYFVWSLMDNYEWAEGFAKRFGIVRVDFDTLERTPKASYHALAQALERS